ncbi:nucleoside diphosphate kinase regulator [Phyllobacterium sp. SB3]|uniref:nucleoside diphosphate kinase regulator n=1 Tax=Phyllobacterium sp. SB3 TaxID=3156073 RepID=UPI0032AEC9E6
MQHIKNSQKPSIVIGKTDHVRLNNIAAAAADRFPEISESLSFELDRARVVADGSVPGNVVRMGSVVTYRTDADDQRTITLVYPGDADISEGKVSILTPIGTALVGLKTGMAMEWTTRDGRLHKLTPLIVQYSEQSRSSRDKKEKVLHGWSDKAS